MNDAKIVSSVAGTITAKGPQRQSKVLLFCGTESRKNIPDTKSETSYSVEQYHRLNMLRLKVGAKVYSDVAPAC